MATNLLDLLRSVTDKEEIITKVSQHLGELSEPTTSAINSALPAILAKIVQKSDQAEGAARILEFIKNEHVDGSILNNVSELLHSGATIDDLINKGSGMIAFIFDHESQKSENLITAIQELSLTRKESANMIVNIVAPLVLHAIGKSVQEESLDSEGLARLLNEQRSFLANIDQPGLWDKVNYLEREEPKKETSKAVKTEDADDEEDEAPVKTTNTTLMSRLGPWLLLISIALGLLFLMRSCGGRPQTSDVKVTSESPVEGELESKEASPETTSELAAVPDTAQTLATEDTLPGVASRSVVNGIASIRLPDGSEIKAGANSFLDQVFMYLNSGDTSKSPKLTFDDLTFQTATANIAASSLPQLQGTADLLRAFPGSVIEIEGHTDDSGEPTEDKLLSEQRALAVKKALNEKGIANDRMTTAGYGQERPIVANDTEAGKRINRRVEIYISWM